MKTFKYLLMLCFLVPFFSCTDENEGPVLPHTYDEVVPGNVQTAIESHMPIYNGITPPDVSGTYVLNPLAIILSTDSRKDPPSEYADLYLNFWNESLSSRTLNCAVHEWTESMFVNTAYISGSGNNFTVYYNAADTLFSVPVKMAVIISGIKTPEGINNFYQAYYMLEKAADGDHKVLNVNEGIIFTDKDGLVENISSTKSGK